eukprot:symbB.v1.2.023470.t1/scaffold2148.1/size153101/8
MRLEHKRLGRRILNPRPSVLFPKKSAPRFARSVGFSGDVSQLWEEAQAAAAKEAEEKAPQKPQARRDERPVAADIQLRPSADSADVFTNAMADAKECCYANIAANAECERQPCRLMICSRCHWACRMCCGCLNNSVCPKCGLSIPAGDSYSDTGDDDKIIIEKQILGKRSDGSKTFKAFQSYHKCQGVLEELYNCRT